MGKQVKMCPKLSKNRSMMKKKVIDEMEKGKKCANILRNVLLSLDNGDHEDYMMKTLDHHCRLISTSFITCLSLVRSCEFNKEDGDLVEDSNHPVNNTPTKDTRGPYKRRMMNEGRVEELTDLRDDGFGWRKYGHKVILNAPYPRNYYRCTHKNDRKCPATKQVQQISENPTKYRIIYHGNHICNYNLFNQSPIIIDDDKDEDSSTIVLRFDQKNQLNHPSLLFPNSASSSATAMKQEYDTPSTRLSSSTIVSEHGDLVSTAEKNQVEDDSFWTNLGALHELFHC